MPTVDPSTERQALEVEEATGALEVGQRLGRRRLHPNQLAAAISLAYNIGTGGYCGSTVDRRFDAGQWRAACDAFLLWNKAGGRVVNGLDRRRRAERDLCLKDLPL
ncbi:lysozyme [Sphingomonas aerolata]|uniref:lysozyme n=1 Tax=Sphingomonas aerolata TaxID=185951 RepID=UPI003A5C4763